MSPNAARAPVVDPLATTGRPSGSAFDPLIGIAPSLTAIEPGHGTLSLTASGGARWRVYVLPLDRPAGYLVAVAPLRSVDALVARLRDMVGLLAGLGGLVTLSAGWLLASRALRPVAALTETANAIAESGDFERRVCVDSRRDELGRMAETFNRMLASIEQAYQAQQRFVSDASHELRAPLTAIQGNLELLESQPNMPAADRDEALAEASRETRRLSTLVADLLALARADAGVPLRLQRMELDRTLLEALREARRLARGQTVELGHLEPVLIDGDPDRVKQLLLILLDNAIKYTPSTGRVTVGLRRTDGSVEISVEDSGVGISPEDLPHVFERFYRADPARTRDPGGSGLGLPIARWLAEQHGGVVALTCAPGRGTIATVQLPSAPNLVHDGGPISSARPQASLRLPSGTGATVTA